MNTKQASPDILKSKKHFEILDGLRGVAAVSVVIFHFMEVAYTNPAENFIGHGFLAVDFFFCLSGFVIGYAYDDRIGKMGIGEFFKSRLIRLHPLVILGSVLGLLALFFDPFGGNSEVYSVGRILLIFLCSVLLIPFPVMEDRGFNLFGLNAPSWSLFWEYIANIVYALVLARLARRYLLWLLIPAAAGLCLVAYRSGNLVGGWGGSTFWDGSARIAYSFLAGLIIFRYNLIIKSRLGFVGLAVLLSFAFLMPHFQWNALVETLIVLIYFPLLVALGAGATLAPGLRPVCVFAGNISYPLYMTHYMVIWAFLNFYTSHKPGPGELTLIIIAGVAVLLFIAFLAMKFYDIPLRRYLTSKRKQALQGKEMSKTPVV